MTRLLLVLLVACSSGTSSPLATGMHRVSINGAELRYHVHGAGPVVMAIAGGPGASWDYLRMTGLEKHAKVVYVELVGTGDSARLSDPKQYSRERDVADVEGFRAHIGVDKVIVLGHSYGGHVALEYALRYPDRLSQSVRGAKQACCRPRIGVDRRQTREAGQRARDLLATAKRARQVKTFTQQRGHTLVRAFVQRQQAEVVEDEARAILIAERATQGEALIQQYSRAEKIRAIQR